MNKWIDYLGDLLSGRIYNTLRKNYNTLRDILARIQILEDKTTMLTKNELAILGAAQVIGQSATAIQDGINKLTDKLSQRDARIADLEAQLGLDSAPPEDVTDEVALLLQATDQLAHVTAALGNNLPPVVTSPVDVSVPNVEDIPAPVPAETLPATPLATSGPSDTVPSNETVEGEQFNVPAQPGTGGGGEISGTPIANVGPVDQPSDVPAEVEDWLEAPSQDQNNAAPSEEVPPATNDDDNWNAPTEPVAPSESAPSEPTEPNQTTSEVPSEEGPTNPPNDSDSVQAENVASVTAPVTSNDDDFWETETPKTEGGDNS